MSKRISLSKLAKKVEEKKEKEGYKTATSSTKGVVIHEKWPREEAPDSSPSKKVKINDSKGKKIMPPPKVNKIKPSKVASKQPIVPKEGTLASPGDALGSRASLMASSSVAEKILARVIFPADKERVEKSSLDQVAKTLTNWRCDIYIYYLISLANKDTINWRI